MLAKLISNRTKDIKNVCCGQISPHFIMWTQTEPAVHHDKKEKDNLRLLSIKGSEIQHLSQYAGTSVSIAWVTCVCVMLCLNSENHSFQLNVSDFYKYLNKSIN